MTYNENMQTELVTIRCHLYTIHKYLSKIGTLYLAKSHNVLLKYWELFKWDNVSGKNGHETASLFDVLVLVPFSLIETQMVSINEKGTRIFRLYAGFPLSFHLYFTHCHQNRPYRFPPSNNTTGTSGCWKNGPTNFSLLVDQNGQCHSYGLMGMGLII